MQRAKAFITACLLGAALSATAPAAATRTSTGSVSKGSASRQTTTTGFDGKTHTSQNNAAWGNGTYTDTRSETGRNGRTRTGTVTRTNGTATRTVTGRAGNTRTYSRPTRLHR